MNLWILHAYTLMRSCDDPLCPPKMRVILAIKDPSCLFHLATPHYGWISPAGPLLAAVYSALAQWE